MVCDPATAKSPPLIGTATRDTQVNVTAMSFSVSGTPFYDWRAHGTLNFVTGFAHSSDIYFYTLAGGTPFAPNVRGVGPEAIAKYGKMLGFGAPTGIDLPDEAAGIMPSPEWKLENKNEPWTIGNTYQEAIGQGFVAVTPLQLLNAYASVANGGTLWQPHLLKQVVDSQGKVVATPAPQMIRKLDITQENLRLLRESEREAPDRREDRNRRVRGRDGQGRRGPKQARLPQLVRLVPAAG